jgi:hypothetical protein
MFRKGDLVRSASGASLGTVVRGPYTHRFMEEADHELCAAGHGDLAGVYTTAYDIVVTSSDYPRQVGRKKRITVASKVWKKA